MQLSSTRMPRVSGEFQRCSSPPSSSVWNPDTSVRPYSTQICVKLKKCWVERGRTYIVFWERRGEGTCPIPTKNPLASGRMLISLRRLSHTITILFSDNESLCLRQKWTPCQYLIGQDIKRRSGNNLSKCITSCPHLKEFLECFLTLSFLVGDTDESISFNGQDCAWFWRRSTVSTGQHDIRTLKSRQNDRFDFSCRNLWNKYSKYQRRGSKVNSSSHGFHLASSNSSSIFQGCWLLKNTEGGSNLGHEQREWATVSSSLYSQLSSSRSECSHYLTQNGVVITLLKHPPWISVRQTQCW